MKKVVLQALLDDFAATGIRDARIESRWLAVDKLEFEEMESVLRAIVRDRDKPGSYRARDILFARAKAILEGGNWHGRGEGWGE